ncbi:fatty acid-binding protein 2, liver-like [Watersipora subatra]|uniref:fatty acid-binding protein 2, liver-like n=1 Tax=Watersipora subatra TaxID=2589382 RepID=UPI00355C31B8
MPVVQSLVGTWKIDNAATENLGAYLEAIGLAGDMIEGAAQAETYVEWSVNGDKITQTMKAKDNSHETTFTLGNEFSETLVGGKVCQTTFTEEGGKLVRKQKGSLYNCTTTIELIGGQLIETRTCESSPPVSCVRKMIRA